MRQSACPEGLGCQEAGRTQSLLPDKWLNRTKSSQSPFVDTDRKVGEIALGIGHRGYKINITVSPPNSGDKGSQRSSYIG